MPMLAAVKAEGRRYSPFLIPRRSLTSSDGVSTEPFASLAIEAPPYNRHAAAHALAHLHEDLDAVWQHKVCARAELDEPETLAQLKAVAGALPADDPAREHARNLFTDHSHPLTPDRQRVLLVHEARVVARGRDEPPLRVGHVDDFARDGRAVDVHVERGEEDADDGRRACV